VIEVFNIITGQIFQKPSRLNQIDLY